MSDVQATHISLHQKSRMLEIYFNDATTYKLPWCRAQGQVESAA
jgi:hypothetical protein